MDPENRSLSKDDLFLLLQSYKNSVEMNTIISQQLNNILESVENYRDEIGNVESNLKEKIETAITIGDKIRDNLESHNTQSIKNMATINKDTSKITNKVNLLYVGIGSIVVSLFVLIIQIISKYDTLKMIAEHLGV
jgi:predicted PurR-regulated permease PerM